MPDLLSKLFPVQSPLMCAAIYVRKELGITDRLAFISPCIAKKMEIDDPDNHGYVSYNVTFKHLVEYAEKHNLYADPCSDEIEYGLGSIYPMPGGLKENVLWLLGQDEFIRQVEGEKRLFHYLAKNREAGIEGKCGENLHYETNESEISRLWVLEGQRGNLESKTTPEIRGEVQAEAEETVLQKLECRHGLPAQEAQRGYPRMDQLFCHGGHEVCYADN